MPTIKDVAKKAGVGIGTVSRVLNKSGSVSAATRAKIEAVILEMGYSPNEIARSMIKQKSRLIAFVVPHSNHMFFSELIYYVEQELYQHGFKLMVCNSGSTKEKELELIQMLRNNRVDGLIFLTSNDIESEIPKGYPIVSFDRRFQGIPYVASDNYEGGRLAAKTLLQSGAKRLLFIGDDAQGELSNINTEVSKRRVGFKTYCDEVGFQHYKMVEYPQGDMFIPVNYIRDVVLNHLDYDGIFAISDQLAYEVMKILKEASCSVPEDIKVIGYDGIKFATNLGLKITTIEQPIVDLAKAMVESLINQINKIESPDVILPIRLQLGDTT